MKLKKLILITAVALMLLSAASLTAFAAEYTVTNVTDMQKHIAGIIVLPEDKQKEYDFNKDGILNITDTTYLQKLLAQSDEIKYPSSLSLDKTDIELGEGETYTLSVNTDLPDFPFVVSSSNSSVATVDNSGKVQALSSGTATITCSSGNGLSATCEVTVKDAPTSADLSVSSKQLKVGETFTITSSVNDEAYSYNSSWSSSNTDVVKIEKTSGNQVQISSKMQGTAKVTFTTYNGVTASCTITVQGSVIKCLDVSDWQYSIDFNKVKADGYDYVIIRAGYGKETYQKDARFEENYKNAKAAGLKVGAYWYSYATSAAEALEEAEACLYCIDGKTFDMPLYYDVEETAQAYLSKTELTNLIDGFCSTIESNGHKAGVYSNNSMYGNMDKEYLKSKYSTWLAQIDGDFTTITDDVHQYTWTQKVDGISTDVDCNYIYNLHIIK